MPAKNTIKNYETGQMVKKVEPHSQTYERMANSLARSTIRIKPCARCGAPHIDIYCCGHCGTGDPDG